MTEKVLQNVLIVNDEPVTTRLMLEVLAEKGIHGTVVYDSAEAATKLLDRRWDLVLADVSMSRDDGLAVLRAAKQGDPELPVVAISRHDSANLAVKAMRSGYQDFLVKPLVKAQFEELIDCFLPSRAVPLAATAEEDAHCLYQITGKSQGFLDALKLAKKVAPTSLPVLITGESGTGKELLSYYLHCQSQRRGRPYIRVNCAALSESLLESELFGHERGAFTGAYTQRKGRFELAHGGTLLLDEISETSPRLQAKLLRVLEQQDFERVGGSESVHVNVRVISTSNRDLLAAVEANEFRQDLYYRICGLRLHIPPLRERRDDISALVWHFVNLYAKEVRRRITQLDEDMMGLFDRYRWSGNVRHLRSVVRTALILGTGPTLSLYGAPHLLKEFRQHVSHTEGKGPDQTSQTTEAAAGLQLQELERRAVFEALRRTNSHQAKAADLLGITDRTLREKLRRYRKKGLTQPTGDTRWQMETV